MAKRHKLKITILSIFFFVIFTGIHTVFTAFNRKDWLKFYTSCFGTGEVKWELLALLTVVNMLLLLLNVNYKENINHLNNKKSETSDINDDLINVDMHEFSNNEKDESSDENEKEKKYNKLKIRYLYNVSNSIICYYSLWILCYYLIYFLCFLSFLYGIRKFNNNVINIYTLRTCKIDKLTNYILSENTFISLYWAIINFNVFMSKYTDSFYVVNYFKLNFEFSNRKKKTLFILNYMYQLLLLSYTIYKNITLYTKGEYNLNQIICALIFLCLILYTILEITYVLEINRPCYNVQTKLPFHYVWAIIYLFIIFTSSVIFYFSVFSYSIKDQFVNFQITLWLFFISLTYIKKNQLFIKI
ncbi:serpentine receptor, putative [Plasmodium reichenowi]|uniref:GPCR-like receptor SR25 n=15 Tax=Plasmodium (Laverania) TaxID=418107 RepID=Q8IBW3_PLAF7|nr:GPCR-like receptor SR25 [Plasmodium falciparum 3D7]XP_012762218.1 serpentine receptor, putative [Plasmodium reichenowi]ETW19354.1 hypothetical protein PFFVO_01710 [Plasmodium falciparum Vietnam Oak-Knoll (FVO)]ETW37461.1 hypothetical protein PFTANZ_01806 [Plasmodium falciparum Tanzania (2000708)]ETW43715.1 hypothetical protein PFNF135_01839 [Plasmodium falciparum NF135/5.C10]ETW50199.1 hypothetical protein PFMALIP_01743 [Plasmodium falciparum MaliPS096_E11]ETW57060.1 hypothetical protein P|eukprot:XP_001349040.1 serpentine receptor, putative [Plasmodium falciparum 3D7]